MTTARDAVRRAVSAVVGEDDGPVLVACSGGADSLALLDGAVQVGRGRRVIGVTVDHGLQEGSAAQARRVVGQMADLGADETFTVTVEVSADGQGPEAAAREARYAVLGEVAQRLGSSCVLLGHTRDDQAETVLLGLARGSGARSLRGMRRSFAVFHRPLLDLSRAQTEAACRERDLDFWTDPHNADPRFTRARVRHDVMPVLERELGPGVAEALARTADQLNADTIALDDWAQREFESHFHDGAFDVHHLAGLPVAVRTRMLRLAALAAGSPPSELFAVHVNALEAQVHSAAHSPGEV